jgi:hypothetical protein
MRKPANALPVLVAALVAALLPLSPAPAASADNGFVRVGDHSKRSSGLVKELQNGDVSCVMVMSDQGGSEFIEAADFDICFQEPSLIGKRVRLAYRLERVIAESCQGDPECSDSEEVALVVKASIIATPPATKVLPTSLCERQERIVFNCAAGAKRISVCAAHPATAALPYLQYRFGTPGQSPELVLPAARLRPGSAASGENVGYAGGGASWLRFRNGKTAYVVYSGIGRWGGNGETISRQGVAVERPGRPKTHIACSDEATSVLDMDWYQRHGVGIAEGEEFTLP